jgi:predicted Zn-dependent protease
LTQINPNDQSANQLYLKSLAINPYQLDARVEYARYLLQQKRLADAKRIMLDSLGKMVLTETSWLIEYWQLFLQLTEQQSDLRSYQDAVQLQLKHLKQAVSQKPTNKLGYIKLQLHTVVTQN